MSSSEDDVRQRLRNRLQQRDNDPRAQLRQRLGQSAETPTQETGEQGVTGVGQYLDESARSILDNALRLGDIAITGGARMLTGQPVVEPPFAPENPEGAPEPPVRLPRTGARVLPSADQVESGAAAVRAAVPGGESPGDAYSRRQQEISQAREEHPGATAAGEVTGDVATLLTGRYPVRGLVRRLETRAAKEAPQTAATVGQDIQRVFTSSPMRKLARGAGRSVETGLETAVLEVIDGDDPLETAAYAAGSQAAGSAFVHAAKKPKWVASAALAGGALQMLKSATPGGDNYILESIESGFDKVVWGVGLGALSAAGGAGRMGRGNVNMADATRDVMDGLSTVHRGSVLSVLTDWTNSDQEDKAEIEAAIEGAANPEYEPETEKQREVVERLRNAARESDNGDGRRRRGSVRGEIQRDNRRSRSSTSRASPENTE